MFPKITYHQLQKLGNTLIYLAENVSELNKTKVLKLLFLLEESAVKKFGFPFLGLPFYVWKFGPVLKDVYVDLSEGSDLELLGGYIQRTSYDPKLFEPKQPFNDDYFSDNEMTLLEQVAKFAKNKVANDLVNVTHEVDSLWYKTAQMNGVLEALENQHIPTTDFIIDFAMLFENDPVRKEHYVESVENFEFIHQLKG
ncbi:MAG: SocA family protein [Sphingobacteriales bacterium]|nr:SocA family protein [Sphingobacteriales bacterium]